MTKLCFIAFFHQHYQKYSYFPFFLYEFQYLYKFSNSLIEAIYFPYEHKIEVFSACKQFDFFYSLKCFHSSCSEKLMVIIDSFLPSKKSHIFFLIAYHK